MRRQKKQGYSGNNILKLPKPHKGGQRAVYLHPSRFHVLACGRRYGKTTLSKVIAYREMAKNAGEVWYIGPTYRMTTDVWREFLETFSPIAEWVSSQERRIHLPNGGKFVVWAGDSGGDSMRGGAPDLVIIDEAAMLKDSSMWYSVLLPALSDKEGGAYFLSTPRGRNWFYDLYLMGLNPENKEYKSWNFSSYDNPYMDKRVLDASKAASPEKYFRQEYMAEFIVDAGEVFAGVDEVSNGSYHEPYRGMIVIGIDFGRHNDFTVASVIDMTRHQQVDLIRIATMEFEEQRKILSELFNEWKPSIILAEENSFGLPNIEFFLNEGYPIQGHYMTNPSKNNIIMQLSHDIERGNIILLNEPVQIRELQSFTSGRTAGGAMKYSAPSGGHDDTVIALALANWAIKEQNMSFGGLMRKLPGWN